MTSIHLSPLSLIATATTTPPLSDSVLVPAPASASSSLQSEPSESISTPTTPAVERLPVVRQGTSTDTLALVEAATDTVAFATTSPDTLATTSSDSAKATTSSEAVEPTKASSSESLPVAKKILVIPTSATTSLFASATASTTGEVIQAKATLTSDSQIQFEKNDCVAVADGSYYCKIKTPDPATAVKDGLYSKPDADGDLEIYFAHNGTLEQITHNQVDDASPFYDSISNTIVWHRLVNDRYQIISYDVKSGAESQLTTDTVNNMEPTRAGKYTAWQHWNNDNWDIMLSDGVTTKLLTNTPEHDIAPKIRGNLVMWNRLSHNNTQTIELYDLTTGEYTSIADDEGGKLSNPRMVLVYDAQFKNGDMVTKGYDVTTGKITALAAIPVKIPDKIPAPDKTGETRALIQLKSTTREDTESGTSTTPKIDPPDPITGTSSASTTLNLGLQLPVASTTISVATTTVSLTLDLSASTTLQLTSSDVVVPAFIATSTQAKPI